MAHHAKFDTLRGIAALTVLVSHVIELYWLRLLGPGSPLARVSLAAGRHAVLVFFLLSGYLITLSILENARRNARFSPREYLASRIARIHPPLLGALGIMAVVWLIIHLGDLPGRRPYGLPGDLFVMRSYYAIEPSRVLTSVLMLGGLTGPNPPLWSLYFEFQLYVLALLVTLGLTWHGRLPRTAWLSMAALGTVALVEHNPSFVFFAMVWLTGAAAALASASAGRAQVERRLRPLAVGVLAGVAIAGVQAPRILGAASNDMPSYLVQYAFCVLYVYLMFFSSLPDTVPASLAGTGRYSYSLYVVHYPLLFLLLSLTQSWIQYSVVRTALVSAFALLAIVLIAQGFAAVLERPRTFRAAILAALDTVSPPRA